MKSAAFFAGVYVIRRLIGRHRADIHRNGLAFVIVGGVLAPALSALFSGLVTYRHEMVPSLIASWRFHFAGSSLGILALTPFLLTALEWTSAGRRWQPEKPAAMATDVGLLLASIFLAQYIFSAVVPDPWHSPIFIYAMVLAIAFRGKPALTATANFAVATIVIWHTVNGRGLASAFPDWTDALAVIQLLLAIVILTAMIVTSVVVSRNQVAAELATKGKDLLRANAALAEAKEKADDASRAKSAFLANMSHEIRSPLSAMIGFAELLAVDERQAEEGRQHAEIIRRNGAHLHELINQILDLSKVEAGRLEAQLESVNLRELARDVVALMTLKAKEKGVELKLAVTSTVPARIVSDRLRVHQILLNVLGNAVKFTSTGSITLRIDARVKGGRWQITVDVEDTGIGLSEEEAKRLFQVFSQADVTVAKRFGGTGLGLALSQRLARLLGGDMHLLRSEKGRGSTFRFWFDGGDSQVTVIDHKQDSASIARARELDGMRVLLADDSADNRLLVQRYLHLAGAGVHSVANGKEAVEAALTSSFDLVLMDIEMPEMDGLEAIRLLRKKGYGGSVVALTGRAMDDGIDEVRREGFDGHLMKPVDRHALIGQVSRFRFKES